MFVFGSLLFVHRQVMSLAELVEMLHLELPQNITLDKFLICDKSDQISGFDEISGSKKKRLDLKP